MSFKQNPEHTDDFSVLNYLIEHVRGLSPVSSLPLGYDTEDSES